MLFTVINSRRLCSARIARLAFANRPFNILASPNPGWKAGQGASDTTWLSPRKSWDMENALTRDTYKLLTSAIIPRPIAFVSTLSERGAPNLAPFSYFSMVSSNPPMLGISFSLPSKRKKDTRQNILTTKHFTVNLITESFVEAANITAVEASDVNEWILSGLTMEPSVSVKPACVKESPFCMECELYSHQDIAPQEGGEPTTTFVLGRIKRVHARQSILEEDGLSIDPKKLKIVARLGGSAYSKLTDGFELSRPSWKTLKQEYSTIVQRHS